MADEKSKDKRANRTMGLSEAIGAAMDPMFRKRGFATRDIVTNWAAIAPTPYDKVSMPDKLTWPRGAGAEGAILHLRCAESQRLALAHEAPMIAAAVNRYFGYVLVDTVRLSPMPFTPGSGARTDKGAVAPPEVRREVDRAVSEVTDDGVREALRRLGLGLLNNNR